MRRIFEMICLSVLLFGTTSCEDLLNPEPENSVTFYNFFESEEDVATAVYGMHKMFREIYDSYPWVDGSGELADHIKSVETNIRGLRNLDGSLVTDSRPYTSWKGWYNLITQSLVVTENIDRAKLPKERYNYYVGQALFLRALAYFKVIQNWGDCPYVPVSYELEARGRTSWQTVLDTEIKELEQAIGLLTP